MSHFTVGVILPSGTVVPEGVEEAVQALLAPFDENEDVPEYDRPCYCIGGAASRAAREEADRVVGTHDDLRVRMNEEVPKPTMPSSATATREEIEAFWNGPEYEAWDKASDAKWAELCAPWDAVYEQTLSARPDKDAPNPECNECHGVGTNKSNYNPKSKWDWWDIGGRWYGQLTENIPSDDSWEAHYTRAMNTPVHRKVKDNSCYVRMIPESFPGFFALLTPEGDWFEKGHMGWFASVSGERKDWKAVHSEVLSAYPDNVIVATDCHI